MLTLNVLEGGTSNLYNFVSLCFQYNFILQHYGEKVTDHDQPLLVSKPSARERTRGQSTGPVYLIPEFCVLTGESVPEKSLHHFIENVWSLRLIRSCTVLYVKNREWWFTRVIHILSLLTKTLGICKWQQFSFSCSGSTVLTLSLISAGSYMNWFVIPASGVAVLYTLILVIGVGSA